MELLADVADETAFLGVRLNRHIKIVDVAKPPKDLVVSSSIGMCLPLTSGVPERRCWPACRIKSVHYHTRAGYQAPYDRWRLWHA